ncbi:hypothetical protein DSECCO2_192930 [anaerobic digester metagenome]
MTKTKVCILGNEDPEDHRSWLDACKDSSEEIELLEIDLTSNEWSEQLNEFSPHVCLLKPSGRTSLYRQLYQERVEVIVKDLGYKVFPSYDELRIYENKRYFAYWAMANRIPHPKTWVFYRRREALEFSKTCIFPVVAKLNIGASGNGVRIIKNRKHLVLYIEQIFSKGLASRTGPKLNKGRILVRLWNKLINPQQLLNRLKVYSQIAADKQKGFVIFQEFIPHNFEWRAVRIGDSFFAHKKLIMGEKASGSLLKNYDNPPLELLDFIREITDKFYFKSVAVDVFETSEGGYLINEIQCIFGQSDSYQMLVDGKPGRYVFVNGMWNFEAGDFNKNQSYNLRLEYLLNNIEQ